MRADATGENDELPGFPLDRRDAGRPEHDAADVLRKVPRFPCDWDPFGAAEEGLDSRFASAAQGAATRLLPQAFETVAAGLDQRPDRFNRHLKAETGLLPGHGRRPIEPAGLLESAQRVPVEADAVDRRFEHLRRLRPIADGRQTNDLASPRHSEAAAKRCVVAGRLDPVETPDFPPLARASRGARAERPSTAASRKRDSGVRRRAGRGARSRRRQLSGRQIAAPRRAAADGKRIEYPTRRCADREKARAGGGNALSIS